MNRNYHDANINGLFFDDKINKLIIDIEMSNKQLVKLEFIQVIGWEFSPFEMQNTLFDIHEFDSSNIPEWLNNDIPKEYVDLIFSGEHKIFYLDPSVGLGGFVVANSYAPTGA